MLTHRKLSMEDMVAGEEWVRTVWLPAVQMCDDDFKIATSILNLEVIIEGAPKRDVIVCSLEPPENDSYKNGVVRIRCSDVIELVPYLIRPELIRYVYEYGVGEKVTATHIREVDR